MRIQFHPETISHAREHNDGVVHPDYNPDASTSITEMYAKWADDPDFRARYYAGEFDTDFGPDDRSKDLVASGLLDSDIPEPGEMDLEYYSVLRNRKEQRQRDDELNDDAKDVPGDEMPTGE